MIDILPRQKRETAAELARGWQRVVGPVIAIEIPCFFYVLFEPILKTKVVLILQNEIVLSRIALDLFRTDTFLFVIVFILGILMPGVKMMASMVVWYFLDVKEAGKYNQWLIRIGKLSMLDIMLLAIVVIAIKGTGIGSVEILPGLYCYAVLVVASFFTSLAIDQFLRRWEASIAG